MSTIESLIKRRDEDFSAITTEIFDAMDNVIAGVCEYLVNSDIATMDSITLWDEVSLLKNARNSTTVVISFSISQPLGSRIPTEDGKFETITEDNMRKHATQMHVGIPSDLIDNASQQEIVDFLEMVSEAREDLEENTSTSTLSSPVEDFDLSNLSDDQLYLAILSEDSDVRH